MKKVLSVVLCVLMLFSAFSVLAFAAEPVKSITVRFVVNGEEVKKVMVAPGEDLNQYAPKTPTKDSETITDKDGKEIYTKYEFYGWESSEDKTIYEEGSLPKATVKEGESALKTITFYAQFTEKPMEGVEDVIDDIIPTSLTDFFKALYEKIVYYIQYFLLLLKGFGTVEPAA